jgi:hypothetical protein
MKYIFRKSINFLVATSLCLFVFSVSVNSQNYCNYQQVPDNVFSETKDLVCKEPQDRLHDQIVKLSFVDGIERPAHYNSALAPLYALNSIEAGENLKTDAWGKHLATPEAANLRRSLRITLIEEAFTREQIQNWCTAPVGSGEVPSYFGDIDYAIRCGVAGTDR